jgi:predicted aminopeptidase
MRQGQSSTRGWPEALAALWPAVLLALLAGLGGCTSLGYYGQAIAGHIELMRATRPIDDLLADTGRDPLLHERLRLALRLRRFAAEELGLPDNDSYTRYADLDRDYVLWNVFATPALSLESRQWCYPLVGCLAYRGYYKRERAEAHARRLADAGDDVYVGPVAAYSTLGWFDDPLTGAMLQRDELHLARVMFHELAHQALYVRDDTDFNEAFATAVAEISVTRWLAGSAPTIAAAPAARTLAREASFVELLLAAREDLARIFAAPSNDAQKLAAKQARFDALRGEYAAWKQRWDDYPGMDRWMAGPINNARLASVATYHALVPGLLCLGEAAGGEVTDLLAVGRTLAALTPGQRQACLTQDRACNADTRDREAHCLP